MSGVLEKTNDRLLVRVGPALVAVLVAWLIGTGVARAEQPSPWWGLTSSAAPTHIQPGGAQSEVQEASGAVGGEIEGEPVLLFELSVGSGPVLGSFAVEPFLSANPLGPLYEAIFGLSPATDENLQKALESSQAYGPGGVSVTGGPIGTAPITITARGGAADAPLPAVKIVPLMGEAQTKVLTPGRGDGTIVLTAQNLGDAEANGGADPIVLTDLLPAGWRPASFVEAGYWPQVGLWGEELLVPTECHSTPVGPRLSLSCSYAAHLPAGELLEERVAVTDAGATSGAINEASVSGGGAATVKRANHPVLIGGETPFGIENYEMTAEEPGGAQDTQAGSHPFQLTTTFTLNQNGERDPAGAANKDLRFNLPPGLIGNPTPFARCTTQQFQENKCPIGSIVGYGSTTFIGRGYVAPQNTDNAVYNMVPNVGEPARFAFYAFTNPVYLDTSVRTGSDYGVTVSTANITESVGFMASRVTFWGVPGDPRHDAKRGGPSPEAAHPAPLLSLPTSCTGPMQSSMEADSWTQPGVFLSSEANEPMAELDGCNHLPFNPEISVAPDVSSASTPSGLTVGVRIPQAAALNPTGLAESTLKDTTVTLPEGVAVNSGGADGLEACSEGQIGYLQGESTPENLRFTPEEGEPFCPDASKVGTVEIETPLLPNALKGAVYLGTPAPFGEAGMNPFGSLLAMYIVAHDPVSGVLLKLPGQVTLDPNTGRLVATFDHTPPLPFENLRMHFFGGARAPLSTPAKCGSYETQASFVPWTGEASANVGSTFRVDSGPSGGPCESPLPFSPALTAGTTSVQAGGFSPFTMTMSRPDGSQTLSSIALRMPDGLSGELSKVALCSEAQANEGTCGPESQIGESTVSVGVGGNPFTVTGGKVFITGPYHGAPFGLSILTPAKAGPFDLGHVVVRAKIEVDPVTAALTITSNPPGTQYSIPTILHGIPLEIQHINVTVGRPEFTFNPTDCEKSAITGTLFSTENTSDQLSVPFQVTNCAALGFKPGFKVSTSGKTSRANGASLRVKLVYPKAPFGSQANIKSVKVDLPKQLPSRLTTLQKACTSAQFEANPAGCPQASIVGHATAITPLIPVPLTGPAYFVSYGGAKFPELVIVLQGYGVTLDLHGETFISKAGITSSTFHTVPDAPVGSFELTLPQGKYSALAANGNLCKSKLAMPTAFTAQNGAVIHQSTKISVTGCAKTKTAKKKGKKAGKRHKHG